MKEKSTEQELCGKANRKAWKYRKVCTIDGSAGPVSHCRFGSLSWWYERPLDTLRIPWWCPCSWELFDQLGHVQPSYSCSGRSQVFLCSGTSPQVDVLGRGFHVVSSSHTVQRPPFQQPLPFFKELVPGCRFKHLVHYKVQFGWYRGFASLSSCWQSEVLFHRSAVASKYCSSKWLYRQCTSQGIYQAEMLKM